MCGPLPAATRGLLRLREWTRSGHLGKESRARRPKEGPAPRPAAGRRSGRHEAPEPGLQPAGGPRCCAAAQGQASASRARVRFGRGAPGSRSALLHRPAGSCGEAVLIHCMRPDGCLRVPFALSVFLRVGFCNGCFLPLRLGRGSIPPRASPLLCAPAVPEEFPSQERPQERATGRKVESSRATCSRAS